MTWEGRCDHVTWEGRYDHVTWEGRCDHVTWEGRCDHMPWEATKLWGEGDRSRENGVCLQGEDSEKKPAFLENKVESYLLRAGSERCRAVATVSSPSWAIQQEVPGT